MRDKSLKVISTLERGRDTYQIVNLRLTHKKASIPLLEASTFKNPYETSNEIYSFNNVDESIILQTCNRVEIYAVVQTPETETEIAEYWRNETGLDKEIFYTSLERASGSEALLNLLRVSSGLESMMVGEDQILGQVKDTYINAKKYGTTGPILDTVLRKAIKTGRDVRYRTGINKGAVSIGSAAIILLENLLGDLGDREIAIFGAGETATLVGKALSSKKHVKIFVANRTYERGVRLAKILDGRAVRFDKIKKLLTHIDAAIVATAAPHHILTKELLESVLNKRINKRLIIIDLSQPRNVEESVATLSDITLYNIDDLREISEVNIKARLEAVRKAEVIIGNELKRLESLLKRERAEHVISAIWFETEDIRHRELNEALRMLGNIDEEQRKIVEKLTQVLVKRILHNPIEKLRKAAASDDIDTIRTAQLLFNVSSLQGGKME